MSDKLTVDDVNEQTVRRDSNGDLIPETHEIEWGDDTKTVETVPITTGVINELSHIDDEIMNLEPQAVYEAFRAIYVTPDPSEFSVKEIQDLEFQYLEALMSPLDEQMSEDIESEGNPTQARRNDRAHQMR